MANVTLPGPGTAEKSFSVLSSSLRQRPSLAQLLGVLTDISEGFILGDFAEQSRSRYSYFGINPARTVTFDNRSTGNPLDLLESAIDESRYDVETDLAFPFCGGWVGFLGYDLGRTIEKLPDAVQHDLSPPLLQLGFYDAIIAWNHQADEGAILALDYPDQETTSQQRLTRLEELLDRPVDGPDSQERPVAIGHPQTWVDAFQCNMTQQDYLSSVARAQDYIKAGDIYEVNLSQRYNCSYDRSVEGLYAALTDRHPAAYTALIKSGDCCLVSDSPELFLQKRGCSIMTRPIKGTIARGADTQSDLANREKLIRSEKDQAELNMIVDLERNDLGRICEYGSIAVPQQRVIEEHPTLYHAVATVAGQLREEVGLADMLRATFPGGSVTGAPKIRAMEIIDELEPTARSAYTGGIGWIGVDGNCDLNIAIRTIILEKGQAYFQVGGAIVDDSDPQSEYNETLVKAQAMAQALLQTRD